MLKAVSRDEAQSPQSLPPLAQTQVLSPIQPFSIDKSSKESFRQALDVASNIKHTPISIKLKSSRLNSFQNLESVVGQHSSRQQHFHTKVTGGSDINYDQFKMVDKVKEFETKYLEPYQQKLKNKISNIPTTLQTEMQVPQTSSKQLTTSWTLHDQVKIYYPDTLQ